MKGGVRRRQSGDYEFRFDAGFDPLTGQRRRPGRSGFKTKREAEQALRAAITAHEKGRGVRASSRTVGQFLEEWHAAIKVSIRPTTWVNYRNYVKLYVIPHIGDTRLQDLTPVRLNLLYALLLDHGRAPRRRRAGAQDDRQRAPHAASRAARCGPLGHDTPQRR